MEKNIRIKQYLDNKAYQDIIELYKEIKNPKYTIKDVILMKSFLRKIVQNGDNIIYVHPSEFFQRLRAYYALFTINDLTRYLLVSLKSDVMNAYGYKKENDYGKLL